ncbi:MAG: GntR family transcriptional regulator [Hyphomicrobiales bacterium]|nr:MAG: GntR family transcriptional regulator [Hyphomicrobiales bacterium]
MTVAELPSVDVETNGRRRTVRDQAIDSLRLALITGQIVPGNTVTLRGLAATLGTSMTPVREAIRTLAAENAIEVRDNGRIQIPQMTEQRFEDLVKARVLLEPEAAAAAMNNLDSDAIDRLQAIDDEIDASLESGDVEAYMRLNHDFHFALYEASGSKVFLTLIESLWLQFGPFMRTVYGRVGTIQLDDQHKEALDAIRAGNVAALKRAIAADILDGMRLIGVALLPGSEIPSTI